MTKRLPARGKSQICRVINNEFAGQLMTLQPMPGRSSCIPQSGFQVLNILKLPATTIPQDGKGSSQVAESCWSSRLLFAVLARRR